MDVTTMAVDRTEAERLYRKYKEHRAYSQPIDWEIQRTYQLLARGKVVIRALDSIVRAGVNAEGLPKLALCRSTAKTCFLQRDRDGSAIMSSMPNNFWRPAKNHTFQWRESTFAFPRESFPFNFGSNAERVRRSTHRAQVPLIPVHLRPRRGLPNYHTLFEAEWSPEPPRDPYLLRRIGQADLWLIVASWELTDVERAALSTRVVVN
jgi:hypothetical protein